MLCVFCDLGDNKAEEAQYIYGETSVCRAHMLWMHINTITHTGMKFWEYKKAKEQPDGEL